MPLSSLRKSGQTTRTWARIMPYCIDMNLALLCRRLTRELISGGVSWTYVRSLPLLSTFLLHRCRYSRLRYPSSTVCLRGQPGGLVQRDRRRLSRRGDSREVLSRP